MGVNCLIFSGNTESPFRLISAGPYRIATQLRENGFTVQIVDICKIKKFSKLHEYILKKFVDKDTLWIGFSVNFLSHIFDYKYFDSQTQVDFYKKNNSNFDSELIKFIDFVKSINPKIQFILGGGKLFSLDYLNFYQFRGYTDEQIVDFTKNLSKGSLPSNKTIYNREYKNFHCSKITYLKNDVLNYKTLAAEISRGCIFKCKFCSFPLNGKTKGDWVKNYDILKEEFIYNYENFGIINYTFTDDTYNDSCEKIQDLYEKVYSKLPFKISFSTYMRLDLIHRFPHTAELLKESGVTAITFGIETLNRDAAKLIGKGLDPYKQIDFLQKLKLNEFKNILLASGWILGLPTDTKESLINFSKWVISNDNPLNDNLFSHFGVMPPEITQFKLYRSEFDLTWKNYDMEFELKNDGHFAWKYKNEDLDSDWCRDLSQKLHSVTYKKDTYGGFYYNGLINLGFSHNEIAKNTKSFFDSPKVQKVIENSNKTYFQTLLSL